MFELLLLAPEDAVEPVSDALIDELGALSASVEDADADTDAEHALFGEPGMPAPAGGWRRSRVIALFADEAAATEAATLLLAQDWAGDVSLVAMRPVAEQDWVRLTQSQFAPVEVAPGFWIVPSWHEVPPQASQVIRLDLDAEPLPHLTATTLVNQSPSDAARVERVLEEFLAAEVLVIGAPMYNFSIPSTLKTWIDRISVPGRTFRYSASGITGLAGGKRVEDVEDVLSVGQKLQV